MSINLIVPIILGVITAVAAVNWIYFKILKIALDKKLVDVPDARKLQKRPIPVVGGLAVFFGVLAGMMIAAVFNKIFSPDEIHISLFPILAAMGMMLYIGAMDDIIGLTPKSRFIIEIAATSQEDKDLLINFSKCQQADGNIAAALGAILDKLLTEGFSIKLSNPSVKQVRKVFSRNHFFRAWEVKTQTEERENYIDYKRFESDDSTSFKTYIDNGLIHKQKFPKHTDLAAGYIIESIYEIYANATMHGKTDFVYSCGEYKEDSHILEMTIVDCGVTIPQNVNNYLQSNNGLPLSDCDAIKWAFEKGNTTKDIPGGLGLAILKDFIKMNNGSIQMISGNGMIEIHGDEVEHFLLSMEFPGTIVNMKFNFDDNKNYFMTSERKDYNANDLL